MQQRCTCTRCFALQAYADPCIAPQPWLGDAAPLTQSPYSPDIMLLLLLPLQMLGERGPEVAALSKLLSTSGLASKGDSMPHAHAYEDSEGQFQLYEALEDIHGDQDVQRYLQMEFDPLLEVRGVGGRGCGCVGMCAGGMGKVVVCR